MRKLCMAALCAAGVLAAGQAGAAEFLIDFSAPAADITAFNGPSFGLTSIPDISGSILIDDAFQGPGAARALNLTIGDTTFDIGLLDSSTSTLTIIKPPEPERIAFDLVIGNLRISGPAGDFYVGSTVDGEGGLKCNACLSFSSPIPVAALPEPETWALMIAGFGLAGAALRRKRAVA